MSLRDFKLLRLLTDTWDSSRLHCSVSSSRLSQRDSFNFLSLLHLTSSFSRSREQLRSTSEAASPPRFISLIPGLVVTSSLSISQSALRYYRAGHPDRSTSATIMSPLPATKPVMSPSPEAVMEMWKNSSVSLQLSLYA